MRSYDVQLLVCVLMGAVLVTSVHGRQALASAVAKGRKEVEDPATEQQRVLEKADRLVASKANPTNAALDVNLMTGDYSGLPNGMEWYSPLTKGSGNCTCDRQGVLKLTIEDGMAAEVKMTFSHSYKYSFNIGDSSTNNAWAGDSSTQSNDAEVHSYNNALFFYGKDKPITSGGGSYGLLHHQSNFVAVNPYTTITFNVADELATADNGLQYLNVNTHKLFALRGQADSGGVNNDVYLGLNRVVKYAHRAGSGLCRVTVNFYRLPQ